MAGSVLDLQCQLQHRFGDRAVGLRRRGRHAAPTVDLFRPRVLLTRFVPECFGHVAHRGARPIGDHVRDLRGVVAPVPLVHVLDHLLPSATFYVDIDVRRAVALGRQEPLEQQPERHRVGGRDPDGVADRRVGRTPPPLAEDVRPATELDDVPHDQEVAGEVELLDQRQLVIDRLPSPRPQREILAVGRTLPVAAAGTLIGHLTEELHLGETGRARERRQLRRHQRQVERCCSSDLGGPLDHTRIPPEPPGLLGARTQMGARRSGEPRIDLVEAPARPHRSECSRQPPLRRGGVVDVVGRHTLDAFTMRQFGQRIVARRVERITVIPQFDEHTVTPERIDQPEQFATCSGRAVVHECSGNRTFAAPGERPDMPGSGISEVDERELWRPLLSSEVPGAQRPRQPGIAGWAIGEDDEMGARRVGGMRVGNHARGNLGECVGFGSSHATIVRQQRDLGTEHSR